MLVMIMVAQWYAVAMIMQCNGDSKTSDLMDKHPLFEMI